MFKGLVFSAVACLIPALCAAQNPGPYRFPSGDTVRYREVSNSEVRIQTPQGEIAVRSEHDATVGIVPAGPGNARAWYEALRLRAAGPNGDQTPATTGLLGRPYELKFSPEGHVELVTAPEFPEDIAAITDLTQQFLDFFVSMPAGKPGPGDVWQDTIRSTRSGDPAITKFHESVRRFRVRGDTILDGDSALVIEVVATQRVESSGPMEGQPLTVTSKLSGEETGIVVFDWVAGRLLFRAKAAKLRGTFRIEGAPQPIEYPQMITYTSTIQGVK